jgi:hypothetical protein
VRAVEFFGMPESIRIGHFTADKTDYNTSIAIRSAFSGRISLYVLREKSTVIGARTLPLKWGSELRMNGFYF